MHEARPAILHGEDLRGTRTRMSLDVLDLKKFYAGDLGGVVRRVLTGRIRARWRHTNGLTMMGLGFATPYLTAFRGEALRMGALMPASQGALVWPSSGAMLSVMVEGHALPLPDNSVDRLLAVHSLEAAGSPHALLREMWRVLTPEGRLILIVPNRRGVWSRRDATPFGHGQPYSRGQLERLLTDALFTPVQWETALHMPPVDRRFVVRWANVFERLGSRMSASFAGVILVEAQKEVMAPIGTASIARRVRHLATAPAVPARRAGSGRDGMS
jgi:SAM-dependent methyltransferase